MSDPAKGCAVFFDRDGVLNRAILRDGVAYPPMDLSEFVIFPDAKYSCEKLKQSGYLLIVVTNQPDVGRKTLNKAIVENMHEILSQKLPIDRIEVCYHPGRGESDCDCRKPRPGMILAASRALGIDLKRSWMIGDQSKDIECGQSAGCSTILIGDGYGQEIKIKPDFQANTLREAVIIILKHDKLYETKKS